MDADGILTVAATEFTGEQAQVEVKPAYGLSDDEIEGCSRTPSTTPRTTSTSACSSPRGWRGEILHHIRKALSKDADLLQGGEGALRTSPARGGARASDRQRILQLG